VHVRARRGGGHQPPAALQMLADDAQTNVNCNNYTLRMVKKQA